jgi:hypothetical protein
MWPPTVAVALLSDTFGEKIFHKTLPPQHFEGFGVVNARGICKRYRSGRRMKS